MKDKLISVILCAALVLSLTACGAADIMGQIRGESGVRTSKAEAGENVDDAGRPDDANEQAMEALKIDKKEKLKLEDTKNYGLDNVYVGWTITYPEDLPNEMIAKLVELKDGFLPGGDGSDIVALGKANRGIWVSYTVEINCEAFEEGYYAVSSDVTDNINKELRWNKYRYLKCFDAEFNQLAFEDIFEPTFDYDSYLLDAIKQYWMLSYGSNENFALEASGQGGELPDDFIIEFIEKGSFTLCEEAVEFATSPIGITEKSEDSEEPKVYSTPLSISIPYSEIGASKLKIFK